MHLTHTAAETMEQVLNYFTNTPKGRAELEGMTAAKRAQQLEERRSKASRLKQQEAHNLERYKKAEAEMKPLHAAVERATKVLDEANYARQATAVRHHNEASPIEREIDRLRNELEYEIQPELKAFVERVRAEIKTLKHESIPGSWQQVAWSNHLSVLARQEAMLALIQDVRLLAFEPIDGPDLEKRLDKMYRSLPAVEPRPEL